jgi:hypothetical protein
LNEFGNHPKDLFEKLPIKNLLKDSAFIKQFRERVKAGKIKEPNIMHLIINLLGITLFPFVGQPLIIAVGELNESKFNKLMQERKKMIPVWIKAMLETD